MTARLAADKPSPADGDSAFRLSFVTINALTDAAMTVFGTLHRLELDRKHPGRAYLRSLLMDLDLFGPLANSMAYEEYRPAA